MPLCGMLMRRSWTTGGRHTSRWPPSTCSTVAVTNGLRITAAADPDAADLAALVRELGERSEEFAGLWRHYDVRVKRGADRKTFRHPSVGELTLTSEVLNLAHGEQRLVAQPRPRR